MYLPLGVALLCCSLDVGTPGLAGLDIQEEEFLKVQKQKSECPQGEVRHILPLRNNIYS